MYRWSILSAGAEYSAPPRLVVASSFSSILTVSLYLNMFCISFLYCWSWTRDRAALRSPAPSQIDEAPVFPTVRPGDRSRDRSTHPLPSPRPLSSSRCARLQMVLQYKGLPFKLTPVAPDAKVSGPFSSCLPAAAKSRRHRTPPTISKASVGESRTQGGCRRAKETDSARTEKTRFVSDRASATAENLLPSPSFH